MEGMCFPQCRGAVGPCCPVPLPPGVQAQAHLQGARGVPQVPVYQEGAPLT